MSMRDYYTTTLDAVIDDLGRSNPEWSDAVKKWKGFLARAAYLISETTGCDAEDALGDIFEAITFVFDLYRGDIYKYDGNLYRIQSVVGGNATIVAVRSFTRDKDGARVVPRDDLEEVQRGKLDTMLYHCVYQQYVNILRSNFTRRNGYIPVDSEESLVASGFGKGGRKLVRRRCTTFSKVVSSQPLEKISVVDSRNYMGDVSTDPEECVCVKDVLQGLEGRLSKEDQGVLSMLLEDPSYTLREIAADTGIPYHKVWRSRVGIKRTFQKVTEGLYVNHER